MSLTREIPYYADYISDALLDHLLAKASPVPGLEKVLQIGECTGLENLESLRFACALYEKTRHDLNKILVQRQKDRTFIDEQTRLCVQQNNTKGLSYLSDSYQTVIGCTDSEGRVVVGPLQKDYFQAYGSDISPIPEWLRPPHVTLFGPPDSAKMAVNAMNAYHRKMAAEPQVVEELLARSTSLPKWGADDEDSKTPLRYDLMSAGENLCRCFDGSLSVQDGSKLYAIIPEKRALPIKRIPGFALPSAFLFVGNNPLPLHVYDFALHLFHQWHDPKSLVFYVPKLENEEEARYLHTLIARAEQLIADLHPEYKVGSIRIMAVIENPRAIFRVNEIIDALQPYFAGASLGWHDYLGSTARLFKEDGAYRIPAKSDPNIVVKYIKASHELLAKTVGPRGGIKVGGMYGVLPVTTELTSGSFQVSMKGFIKDVVTQFKRDLNGIWVAHPDFVRLGLALVQAWKEYRAGDKAPLEELVRSLLLPRYHKEIFNFIYGDDVRSLEVTDARFPRSLLAADLPESTLIANNDEREVRYNVFQSLQYMTDWLRGNGCVALPAVVEGEAVRVMDDLATAERSRWEVWHEVHHGRFARRRLFEIALEELHFIRLAGPEENRRIEVQWNEQTAKWYPVALRLMLMMMTAENPVEFATELLLSFTMSEVQEAADPWQKMQQLDGKKYQLEPDLEKYVARSLVC